MHYSVILGAALVLVSGVARAQEKLTGVVKRANQEVAAFATVGIYCGDSSLSFVVADSTGKFSIPDTAYLDCPAGMRLKATFLEQVSSWVTVGNSSGAFTLLLGDTAVSLEGVTVNSRKAVFLRKADRFVYTPGSVVVNGTSALDVLKRTPLVRSDAAGELFSIIGKSGSVITINGSRTVLPQQMVINLLRAALASDVKSIEIIQNPGSEWGAGMAGGVININLKKLAYEGWQGSVSLASEQNAYNTTVFNGTLNYRKNKIGLQLAPLASSNFNFRDGQNRIDYANGETAVQNAPYFRRYYVTGGSVGLDYDLGARDAIGFKGFASYVQGRSRAENETRFATAVNPSVTDSAFFSPQTGEDTYLYNFGNGYYRHTFDSAGTRKIEFNADYNQFRQRNVYEGSFLAAAGVGTVGDALYNRNVLPQGFLNLSGRVDYTQQLKSGARWLSGGQWSHTAMESDLEYNTALTADGWGDGSATVTRRKYRYEEVYAGLFSNITLGLNDRWSLVAGLRGEWMRYSTAEKTTALNADTSYIALFPSVSVGYAPTEAHQFSWGASRKIIRPTAEQLFPGRIYQSPFLFSQNNPFLRPTTYYNFSSTYTYQQAYTLQAGYSFFRNASAAYLVPVAVGSNSLMNTILNYENAQLIDLTATAYKVLFQEKLETQLSVQFTHARYAVSLPNLPAYDVVNNRVTADFSSSFYLHQKSKLTGGITFNFIGPQQDPTERIVNSRSQLNLSVNKVFRKKLIVSLYLNDLYNGNARYNAYLNTNPLVAGNYLQNRTLSRSVSCTLRYRFGNSKIKKIQERETANTDIRKRTK